ncbi:5-methyltetrahydropteroyltriglutamate/homocysteine S-methyltransferase [Novosphingobium sp. Rr 2-17]|uniref:5-methyltetrahydropteroyltriglutamate-- homocysteine S-methyltransferase n=1 Tax=Novosphingobium sp. Rr 2-17 TaxID=555793 RepID=UPI000269A19E|nr:5-methyltetrahydropteroyltriglutamate--homocysteine S-methyltransferase [Novosphingobium sp. Rr 2-17]EIZ80305.1 5-methyltetrahydropteroyltriglutamate/homocysteine S-methyltransferase [Novosphingobium sp. Rr 2-17]
MTVTVATLGFPRIGPRRELKFALEKFWAGKTTQAELLDTAMGLRTAAWARQKALGADWLPSNDFSLYDHVLDTSVMLGAVPQRYGAGEVGLETYFAMARGTTGSDEGCGHAHANPQGSVTAGELTKWFDTNYHYIVPEIEPGQSLQLGTLKIVEEYREAKALGYETRPVLLGPVTWLSLAKGHGIDPFDRLDEVLGLYGEVLDRLAYSGAAWVQIDEPILVTDLSGVQRAALSRAYAALSGHGVKLMLTTYFGGLDDNLPLVATLPVAGLHVDLVRAPQQLDAVLRIVPEDLLLSLGVIDGRNVWRADLAALLDRLEPVAATRDIVIAPSCSLLHVPVDLASETRLDTQVCEWLAFGVQKVAELATLAKALNQGRDSVAEDLAASSRAAQARRSSPRIHDATVQARIAAITPQMREREAAYADRARAQAEVLGLPLFPTTTIGSFPQTAQVRHARAEHTRGNLDDAAYERFLREETERAIRWQEEVGLDVLVHGEFERNDMVQYFGEQLSGFAFTASAWVQSYGSRCVRPPILYGDVSRPAPMTVEWWRYAQSLTDKPVKGMLTGPVTILNWSFVRDDQPRSASCLQIALAIRDEVLDLEAAGCKAIQIDEAALREGLPLRAGEGQAYLDWAVDSFRLCAAGVADATQVHTHMCYSEFNEILPAIAAMDADVISIETARSQMELLEAFARYRYPSEIGPGVYDIHSARVPGEAEMVELMRLAQQHLAPEQLWVNPDCGLKTRGWEEVKPAIAAMVTAARTLRSEVAAGSARAVVEGATA